MALPGPGGPSTALSGPAGKAMPGRAFPSARSLDPGKDRRCRRPRPPAVAALLPPMAALCPPHRRGAQSAASDSAAEKRHAGDQQRPAEAGGRRDRAARLAEGDPTEREPPERPRLPCPFRKR